MIAQSIAKNQKTWDRNVPELAFAYNSAQHGSTGHSPVYLNYGQELKSRGSLEQEAALPQNDGNVRRLQRLQEAMELARVKIAQSFQKQQKYYDLRRRSWRPSIGDKVLKKTQHVSDKAANFNANLAKKFGGLYVVKKKPSPVIFDLQDDRGRYHRHVHISKLQPYLEAAETQQLMPDTTATKQTRPVPPPRPRQEQRHDTAVSLHQHAEQQTRKHLRRRVSCLGSSTRARRVPPLQGNGTPVPPGRPTGPDHLEANQTNAGHLTATGHSTRSHHSRALPTHFRTHTAHNWALPGRLDPTITTHRRPTWLTWNVGPTDTAVAEV